MIMNKTHIFKINLNKSLDFQLNGFIFVMLKH